MREMLARSPVMPILTLHDAQLAGDLAQALVRGGVALFEVVMRTPQSVAALRAMREAAPDADIGMGTLMTPQDLQTAMQAGAKFGVSPGLTPELAAAIRETKFPFLPGVATASEVMQARGWGMKELKFFPAQGAAGATWIKDMSGVFPDVLFCPLVGFSARGERLGLGAGHYDRWLAQHPPQLAIGLGWDCQLVEDLPVQPHDRQLDAVVTPTRLYGPF